MAFPMTGDFDYWKNSRPFAAPDKPTGNFDYWFPSTAGSSSTSSATGVTHSWMPTQGDVITRSGSTFV
jgi:hypothetical protein